MTKVFDDNARKKHMSKAQHLEFAYNGSKVNTMTIKQISAKAGREYIATYHYSKTFPDSTKFVFAGFYDNILAGIICYGMGVGKNQYVSLINNIQQGEYLELTRLWSHDNMPKNTESKLIAESLHLLPKQYRLILSFADPSKGHVGTIYQATNWLYCGMSNGGKTLVTVDGTIKHVRLIGIYKMRHPELKTKTNSEIMAMYNWTYGISSRKHRYVMIRGDKRVKRMMLKELKPRIMAYPKL